MEIKCDHSHKDRRSEDPFVGTWRKYRAASCGYVVEVVFGLRMGRFVDSQAWLSFCHERSVVNIASGVSDCCVR